MVALFLIRLAGDVAPEIQAIDMNFFAVDVRHGKENENLKLKIKNYCGFLFRKVE
jgi:hypothetical protein